MLGEGRAVKKAPILFLATALIFAALGIYGAHELLEMRYQDRLESKDEQIRLLSLKTEHVTTDMQVTTQKQGGPPELVQDEPTELVLQFPGGTNPPKQLTAKNLFRWYSLVNTRANRREPNRVTRDFRSDGRRGFAATSPGLELERRSAPAFCEAGSALSTPVWLYPYPTCPGMRTGSLGSLRAQRMPGLGRGFYQFRA